MQNWTVGTYLDRLAATRPPTPAGGVVAALAVAQGAALLTMVAQLAGVPDVGARAARLQEQALALGDADMRVFDAVMAAAALPRETDDEQARRSAAVAEALVAAAGPPAEVVVLGSAVVELAEQLAVVAGSAVVADVAAAAEAAAAAVAISRTNVESNLGRTDGPEPARLRTLLEPVDDVLARVAALRADVRRRLTPG